MRHFSHLAIQKADDLLFGCAPKPVATKSGMLIGGGRVYPELNFTLPPIELIDANYAEVRRHYRQIVSDALRRAADLDAAGVVLEFETLPPMTHRPEWGEDLCKILLDGMADAQASHGLRSALRMTPNDNREMVRPPKMRSGKYWEHMLDTFERCAAAGADFLSIESVGGKEVHDEALTMCDIQQVIFALCSMGVRDMRFLWTHIVEIAQRHGVHAAGDTACGFGNTAMVLAEKGMIPRTFAAVVRAVSAVRSLVAYECGAAGPGKDCGYENIILKAITGCPMSMEGKAATCAHLSPVGNVAAAACDLWSNESVQNIRLLGGMAPTCYLENLEYDCRLMNEALSHGPDAARQLQSWMAASDARLDPQAYILTPESAVALANTIVEAPNAYIAGKNAAMKAVGLLRQGYESQALRIPDRELPYLDMIQSSIESMPEEEETFIASMLLSGNTKRYIPEDYELVH